MEAEVGRTYVAILTIWIKSLCHSQAFRNHRLIRSRKRLQPAQQILRMGVSTTELSGVWDIMEAPVDCQHGIVTGVDVFPVNEKEFLLVLRHL